MMSEMADPQYKYVIDRYIAQVVQKLSSLCFLDL